MNGWYMLLWLTSVMAVVSIPLVLFTILMRLVGRIGTRSLLMILGAESILLAAAAFYWWFQCVTRVERLPGR